MTPELMERLVAADPLRDAPPESSDADRREADALLARLLETPIKEPARPRWRVVRLRVAALAAAAVVVAAALTAPGRDAVAWVGDLVGIGEVGGSPTNQKHGFEDADSPRRALVIDNGRAPDGTRYEWVAFPCKVDLEDEGLPGSPVRGYGLALEWPSVERNGGGSCDGERGAREKIPVFGSYGADIVPSQRKGVNEPDVYFAGTINSGAARRVRVVYRDRDGDRRDLPVDFALVADRLHEQVGRGAPRATFTAFVAGAQAARDGVEDCLDLRGAAAEPGDPPGRRCAEQYPEVRAYRARLARCRADIPPREMADAKRRNRCIGPPPPAPLEVIAYDGEGKELGRQRLQPVLLPPPVRVPLGTPPYRGRGPGKRGSLPSQGGTASVLLSGRTPDGAPYEYVAERFERRGRVYSVCLTRWFPYAGGAGGWCGKGFPGTEAYGKPWPGAVKARSFGFLDPGEPATAYLALEGFARARVARVGVTYVDGRGRTRDAPVDLVRVRGKVARRVGAAEPFGFWATFLPPSVRRYYDGAGDRADGKPTIHVIAYDDAGREIGRFAHRN